MKKSKYDKELLSDARLIAEFVRKEFIALDQEGYVGVCVIMPVPKPIHEAIQVLRRFSPNVMRDIEEEVYTAYRKAVGRHVTVSVEEGPDSGSTLQ